ncbi:MAG: hypothetical protein DYH18_10135 [Xanthomonadales bacterium PRO7]|jgi:hypothetical protein|nr:hypothetical protein [Xanthomonadales bacterium PRO7]
MARRLTVQGASDDDAAHLRNLLGQAAPKLSTPWRIESGEDAELLVLDVDTVYGHMDWLRAHNSRLVAVLTAHSQGDEYELVLHKPLTVDNLVQVLDRAAALTDDGPAEAAAPPLPPASKKAAAPKAVAVTPPLIPELPAAPEPPKERRLHDWLGGHAVAVAVRVQTAGAPDLILDPGHSTYYAEGSLRALAPHCGRVVTHEELHEVSPVELARLQASGKGQPFARLTWLSHVLGSNGHPAQGVDVNAKFKMSRWPQIEREFPKHFRIATVMMKQPATLSEIAEQSGASLGDVIDFVNGYRAIGFVEAEAPVNETAPARDSGRAAILSRLKNPFGSGT